MKKKTPLKLNKVTQDLFQSTGWICDVTENYNPFAGKTKDLFGFIDLLATCPNSQRCVAIQTTTFGERLKRLNKIAGLVEAYLWLLAGNEIWIVHWKEQKIGNEKPTLTPDIMPVEKKDFWPTIADTALRRWEKVAESYRISLSDKDRNPQIRLISDNIKCLTAQKEDDAKCITTQRTDEPKCLTLQKNPAPSQDVQS